MSSRVRLGLGDVTFRRPLEEIRDELAYAVFSRTGCSWTLYLPLILEIPAVNPELDFVAAGEDDVHSRIVVSITSGDPIVIKEGTLGWWLMRLSSKGMSRSLSPGLSLFSPQQ